jgi:hypothetical protein
VASAPVVLEPEQRVLAAVNGPRPEAATYDLAAALKAEGMGQVRMYRLFAGVVGQFQDDDPRWHALAGTLDCIWGWCRPGAVLFDDGLTDERLASGKDE